MQSTRKPSAQNRAGKMHQKKPVKNRQNKGGIKEVSLVDYEYKPSSPAILYQGYKKGKEPKNAFRGGNGTYLCYGESPQVMVTVIETEKGEEKEGARTIIFDAYNQLKEQLTEYGGERLTEQRVNKIMAHLEGTSFNITKKGSDWLLPHLNRNVFKR